MRFILVIFLCVIISCQNKKPYDTSLYTINKYNKDTQEISLIEHPYIFEELALKLESLTYKRKDSSVTITTIISGHTTSYSNNCFIFFHAYKNTFDDGFINLDLPITDKNDKLIFSRSISIDASLFKEIRFGLACKNKKERVFALALHDVTFK